MRTEKDHVFSLDSLESRTLLSHGFGHFPQGIFGGPHGHLMNTIEFDQAPTVVQSGLTTLASNDHLAAPTATQTVYLNDMSGVETYTLDYLTSGTKTEITVDQNGNPFTQPTRSRTTWGVLSGTGTGSNAAASGEITAIATALNLTAPTTNTPVQVVTTSGGLSTYTIMLTHANSNSNWQGRGVIISVDSNGNPVGNQNLPFSVMPSAIQTGLNTAAGTTLAATQIVNVRTAFGVTTYSATFTTGAGTETTVTVDSTGALHNLPSRTKVQFQNIPAAAQTELKALAAADGFTGTISPTQMVTAYDEANGTTVYSLNITVPKTGRNGKTHNFVITIASDQLGNPTTPPRDGFGGSWWGHRQWQWF